MSGSILSSLVQWGRPWWLLALAVSLAPVAAAAWGARRGRHSWRPAVAMQAAAIACLTVAMAAPAVLRPSARQRPLLILRDVSDSLRDQTQRPLAWLSGLPSRRIDFAGGLAFADASGKQAQIDGSQTLLKPALDMALARRGQLSHVVLFTDGRFQDDWRPAAQALAAVHVPLVIVPLDAAPADARIADLAVRRTGGGVELAVSLSANVAQRRTLKVERQGARPKVLLNRELEMMANSPVTMHISDSLAPGEVGIYRASLSGGDAFPENDLATQLSLPPAGKVAVVAPPAQPLPELPGELGAAQRLSPADAPASAAGWSPYNAVLLVDSSGELLSSAQRQALAQYVRSGGGLVLVGAGPHATPKDHDDPLNRVLPLVANPYQRRPLKVILVLDSSGSMSELVDGAAGSAPQMKFDLVAEAALALRDHMTGLDSLTVVTFGDKARIIYDSPAGGPDFQALRQALAAVRPNGPTHVLPALRQALAEPLAGREGLVLLLSDLRTEKLDAAALAGQFKQAKLTLAVAAVGQEPSAPQRPLEELAAGLGAKVAPVGDLRSLAQVFAGFIRQARPDPIVRGNFSADVEQSALGSGGGAWPALDAYVASAPQGKPAIIARVAALGEPLAAVGIAGLGQAVCLAVPLEAGNNPAWLRWGGLGQLLAKAAQAVGRPAANPDFAVEVSRAPNKLTLTVQAQNAQGPMNLLDLSARVQDLAAPDDGAAPAPGEIQLRQTGPGRYEAVAAVGQGALALQVLAAKQVVWSGSSAAQAPAEFSAVGADWESLRQLEALTGGAIISPQDLPALKRRLEDEQLLPVWPAVLALALALMLTEWMLARVHHGAKSAPAAA